MLILFGITSTEVFFAIYEKSSLENYRANKYRDNNTSSIESDSLSLENLYSLHGMYQVGYNKSKPKKQVVHIIKDSAIEPQKVKVEKPRKLKIVVTKAD